MESLCRRDFASLFSEGVSAEPDAEPRAARRRREKLFGDSYALWFRRHCDSIRTAVNLIQAMGLIKFLTIMARPLAHIASTGSGQALDDCQGFCGIGGTFAPMPLVSAYAHGLYPRPFFGSLSWWSPATRSGVVPGALKPSQEIAALLENGSLRVTLDRDFDGVVAACSQPRRSLVCQAMDDSGITASGLSLAPALMHSLATLNDLGIAHSFEVWDARNELIGGGYGISVGAIFVCEGLFAETASAALAGLATLDRYLAQWGYAFNDFKSLPPSIEMPLSTLERSDYERLVSDHLGGGRYGRWRAAAHGVAVRTNRPPSFVKSHPPVR
jgi:leucyl/phenylalanyl-tRNA---protein transferase